MSFCYAYSSWEDCGDKLLKLREFPKQPPGIPLQKLCLWMSSRRVRNYEEEEMDADIDWRRVEKILAIGESEGRQEMIQSRSCWRRGLRRDWRREKIGDPFSDVVSCSEDSEQDESGTDKGEGGPMEDAFVSGAEQGP